MRKGLVRFRIRAECVGRGGLGRKSLDDAIGIVDDCKGAEYVSFHIVVGHSLNAKGALHEGKEKSIFLRREKHTFGAATDTTAHPHASVKVQVSRITSLHVHIKTEGIRFRIDLVSEGRVFEFL